MKKILALLILAVLCNGCSNDSSKIDALAQRLDMVISNQNVINGKLDALPMSVRNLDYFYYTNEVNLLETYNIQDTYYTGRQDLHIVDAIGKSFTNLQGKIDDVLNQQIVTSSVLMDSINTILTNTTPKNP